MQSGRGAALLLGELFVRPWVPEQLKAEIKVDRVLNLSSSSCDLRTADSYLRVSYATLVLLKLNI